MKQKDILCLFLILALIYFVFSPIHEGIDDGVPGSVEGEYVSPNTVPLFHR